MTIKQVCQRYGLTQDTLRYYEKIGVIPPVHRSASGIRDYDEHDLGWVENAVCLRNAGVPVESIAEYVKLYQAGDETFAARRDLLSHVLADLTEQRSQLDAAIQKLTYKVSRVRSGCPDRRIELDEGNGNRLKAPSRFHGFRRWMQELLKRRKKHDLP